MARFADIKSVFKAVLSYWIDLKWKYAFLMAGYFAICNFAMHRITLI